MIIRSSHPGKRSSAVARSRTPASKWRRPALTVPNTTRLPSTMSRFQAATSISLFASPPVTLARMQTPSSPSARMAGMIIAGRARALEHDVDRARRLDASSLHRRRPRADVAHAGVLGQARRRASLRAPREASVTSRPRRRRVRPARSPTGPAPSTSAVRGSQSRRCWMRRACSIALLDEAQGLEEHGHGAQVGGHVDEVARRLHVAVAHEAVQALDAALEVVPGEAHVLLALDAGAAAARGRAGARCDTTRSPLAQAAARRACARRGRGSRGRGSGTGCPGALLRRAPRRSPRPCRRRRSRARARGRVRSSAGGSGTSSRTVRLWALAGNDGDGTHRSERFHHRSAVAAAVGRGVRGVGGPRRPADADDC